MNGQLEPDEGRSSTHELGLAISANLLRRNAMPLPIHEEERELRRCLDLRQVIGNNKFFVLFLTENSDF